MSASGHTPHLHLSQYVAGDRPSYVSDYSDDMSRIDTGFNLAQTNALTALTRIESLAQGAAQSKAVGQTVTCSSSATVTDPSDDSRVTIGFTQFESVATRNAKDPKDVPWTWDYTTGMARPVFAEHGVYRISLEAQASFSTELSVSSAYMFVMVGGTRLIPCIYTGTSSTRDYYANGSFVVPYRGGGDDAGIAFTAILNHSTVSDAPVQCHLTIDVEQLSSQFL